ncbi:MAG: phospholipase D family protein [Bacillota bacterium]|nr:phospholipase D family protein [Bacillota bacterium]
MRRLLFLTLALLLAVSPAASASVSVYFSPGVRQHILPLLDQAQKTVDVAMYSFTDSDLAWALVRAHERGVKVRIYLDAEQAAGKYSKSRFFEGRGLAVRYYRGEGIMHHKFAVIDGRVVVTGSYNWTASAEERNQENALIIIDPAIAATYQAEFERLWGRK